MNITVEIPDYLMDSLVDRIVGRLQADPTLEPGQVNNSDRNAYAVVGKYLNRVIKGWYYSDSESIVITDGPQRVLDICKNGRYSPSGAAVRIVKVLNTDVDPNRNGWDFWRLEGTGEPIQTLRH